MGRFSTIEVRHPAIDLAKSFGRTTLSCQCPSVRAQNHGRRRRLEQVLANCLDRDSVYHRTKGQTTCPPHRDRTGFTLIELMVVIAITAILVAVLLSVLSRAKVRAKQNECLSNLKQINLAIRLYSDDYADSLPVLPTPNPYPNGVGAYYKQLVKVYLGLGGPASPDEKVFTCPSDRTVKSQILNAFTSYTFNGYETGPGAIPRITGKKLDAVKSPAKAALVGEFPAFFGGGWHPLVKSEAFPDAKNFLSFVDSHVGFTKIYWDGIPGSNPCNYEPPGGYDYNWDGD